jgi:hypothetical protein
MIKCMAVEIQCEPCSWNFVGAYEPYLASVDHLQVPWLNLLVTDAADYGEIANENRVYG